MADGDQLEIGLYAKQKAFIECQKLRRGFTGGRGSGKSVTGSIDLLVKSKPDCLYMVIAPSYKMLERATMRTFIEYAKAIGVWDENEYRKQERTAKCKNGAEYIFCSADDPESLRGPNASGAWMDEVQDVDEIAYRNVRGCLRQHGRTGWITATFTPGSPDHWTSKEFITTKDQDTAFFRASLRENTFIDPKFYEDQLKNFAASPLMLRREVHGECVYLEGAEWLPDYFEDVRCVEWPKRKPGSLLCMALDSSLGKDGNPGDYAAYTMCLWQDGMLYIDADMRKGQNSSIIAQTGVELYCQWKPDYFVVEEEMGMHMLISDMHRVADARKIVMAITPMDTDKIKKIVRIRRLTPYVSRRMMRFLDKSPGADILFEQMKAFPVGEHDDGPDSLEYNVRMLVKATTGMVVPPRSYGFTPIGSAA